MTNDAVSACDVAGGSYFFTVNLLDRQQNLLVEYVDVLREVMRNVKSAHPFHIDAMVILPDHRHALWTLPAGECDYPMRRMLIKSGFSRRLPLGERRTASRRAKGERGIWQRRYWEPAGWGEWGTNPNLPNTGRVYFFAVNLLGR